MNRILILLIASILIGCVQNSTSEVENISNKVEAIQSNPKVEINNDLEHLQIPSEIQFQIEKIKNSQINTLKKCHVNLEDCNINNKAFRPEDINIEKLHNKFTESLDDETSEAVKKKSSEALNNY